MTDFSLLLHFFNWKITVSQRGSPVKLGYFNQNYFCGHCYRSIKRGPEKSAPLFYTFQEIRPITFPFFAGRALITHFSIPLPG